MTPQFDISLYSEVHSSGSLSQPVFILCLEILFILIKKDYNIKGIENFVYCYLYTAYADNTTFFVKDKNPIGHLSEKFKLFSDFSELKPNTTKFKIAGIVVLKGIQVAVCSLKCIDLRNQTIKILDIYFSFNQKIKDKKN